MGTKVQWAGQRGTVRAEEWWTQRSDGHKGTVDTERQWVQHESGHRGKLDSGTVHTGAVGT